MQICPGCKAIIKELTDTGACPLCGHAIKPVGVATEGPHAATLDVTAEFGLPPESALLTDKGNPDLTMDFTGRAAERSVNIAPRKLSRQSIELITNTWHRAVTEDANERSSLKVDSQSASGSGMGSSLVVNLRGLSGSEEMARPRSTAGADYELLQVIGKGGMGVVYSARQASVDRMVAVKMIRPQVAANPERREKFLSEAVVTGDLDHPNIVPIYELGADESNALFYSMKRVQGTPWSHVIGKKPLGENLEILMKVADAVAFAHANGVVHRDLKPENVMLGDFGEVLVMDWGLALATASFRHAEFVTGPDSMGGTPAYMAPEMVSGPFELIGPPCDIYLLGALLFEVATGLRPHHGKTAQDCLMAAARNEIQHTDKSGELMEIAYRAMATQPTDRFASVQDFQSAIREYHSHMESIALSTRADNELAQALKSGNYQSFARALFGFEEALVLWPGNTRARSGVSETRLAYATKAKLQGDFELGATLLDASNPQHAALRAELEAAQAERSARQKWLSRFKRIAAALAVIVVGVISIALVLVTTAMNREAIQRQHAEEQTVIANEQRHEAENQTKIADAERQKAEQQTVIANEQRHEAENQTKIAKDEREKALTAERQAEIERDKADEARKIAEVKEAEAVLARQGEERAAYTARIGMAAAKIEENAFDTAAALLAACQPAALRDWEWGYLKRLSTQGIDVPAQGAVRAVAFAPTGKAFITAGDDGAAHAWDRSSGKPLWSLDVKHPIHAASYSPDGKLVATAGDDGAVHLGNAADGKLLGELKGHTGRVLSVNFSPDSRWLVSSASDNTARVWDLQTRKETAGSPLRGHYGWVWSAAFAPDGKQLVTTGEDGRAIVWTFDATQVRPDLRLAPRKVFLGHQGAVFTAAISPDGKQIATGGYDKRVLVWQPEQIAEVDLRTLVATSQPLTPQPSRALEGHTGPVRTIRFSGDGEYVISGGDDNTLRVWDSVTGRPHAQLRGHSRPVQACALAPDGSQLLSGGQEGEVKLWNLVDYKQAPQGLSLAGHADSVLAAAYSRDGNRIITAGGDHAARVFDASSGKISETLREGHDFLASRAIYFDGGRRLLTAGGDRTVRIWDAASGTQLGLLEQTGRNATVAVSGDGRWILSGNTAADGDRQSNEMESRHQLALWQLDADRSRATRQLVADASFGTGHPALVTALAVSPDGELLFSGDEAGGGRIWSTATGSLTHRLKGHTAKITAAAFLPNGQRVLTASHDGTVAQWDVATGQELPGMLVHGDAEHRDAFDTPVVAFAVSSDGREVVTLAEETVAGKLLSVIRRWSLAQATLLGELYRGSDALSSLAFTADGRAILSAGTVAQVGGAEGGLVRRFDLTTGREVTAAGGKPFLDLTDRPEGIWSAVEAPGGDGVLTVGGNGAALWSSASIGQAELVFKPHSGVTSTGFSASGKYAVTGSTDRRVKIWNVATGLAEMQLPLEHTAPISSVQFSPVDEDVILTAGEDGVARVWNWRSRKVLHKLAHHPQQRHAALAAMFSPDGQQILTGGADAKLQLWSAADGSPVAVWQAGAPIQAVAMSADGKQILAGLASGQAVVFDAVTKAPLVQYAGHTDAVSAVAFSPEGRRVLTGSRDRLVKVWEATTGATPDAAAGPIAGKELLTLRYHEQAITSVAFSPDGRSILSASFDGTAIVWPTADWQAAQ
jgi:WD40 repeat protein/serine/threonine protein kinase